MITTSMQVCVFRLGPGDDLRDGIERAFRATGARGGILLTCVGSLTVARLRLAGLPDAWEHRGDTEIVSLVGTLSLDGPHLHASLADPEGRVFGGHLLEGSVIRTTAEVAVGLLSQVALRRRDDPATGYPELVIDQS